MNKNNFRFKVGILLQGFKMNKIEKDFIDLLLKEQNIELYAICEKKKNINLFQKILFAYKKNSIYRNFEIFKLDEQISDLSNLKEFDFIKDLKYYSVIESNLILSTNIGPIEEIIFEYKSGNNLIYEEKFIEFNKSIPTKNSSYELFKINNPDEKMPFWFKTINARDSINYVTYFSKTLSKESEKKIKLIFNKSFDSKIISAPNLVNNYRTGNNNIIFQDENLEVKLLDSDGNMLWKKKLDKRIISEIFCRLYCN